MCNDGVPKEVFLAFLITVVNKLSSLRLTVAYNIIDQMILVWWPAVLYTSLFCIINQLILVR